MVIASQNSWTPPGTPVEVKVPGHLYMDLQDAVDTWHKAGDALREATVADARARMGAA